jgi:hypothetical protein
VKARIIEQTEYVIGICAKNGIEPSAYIRIIFEGVACRRNLADQGEGEAPPERTVREAVEHMLPTHCHISRVKLARRKMIG